MSGRPDEAALLQDVSRKRLRRAPTPVSVPGSLPVLFFGDALTARIATVGLNPSDQEFLERGTLLSGAKQRFATLSSLGAASRSELTDEQCDEAIDWMRRYFHHGRPVYGRYFRTLINFLNGWGVDFSSGTAVHLDLVQEATQPRWSALSRAQRAALLGSDLPFLNKQLTGLPFDAVICTGETVSRQVRSLLNVTALTTGTLASESWWAGRATVDERAIAVAGWNLPLHQPTGLGTTGELKLGRLLRSELGL